MFMVVCRFRPDGDLERFQYRVEHLHYMIAALPISPFGGPLALEAGGERTAGAIYALDLPDRAAAEGFVADEPYNRHGLFDSVEIYHWRPMTAALLDAELDKERQRAL